MQYQPYPEYRNSGVEWLGKIPEHWEARRLKFAAEIQNGCDYKEVESSEGYPVFGSGGAFRFATEYLYDGESVLFGRKGTIDKPLYVNEKFWTVDTMFYSVIMDETHGRFLYFFATIMQFNFLATQTALPSITQGDLGNYLIAFPSFQEQQTIARFLDHKTQQIDQLLAKKQTLIDKLNEQRIALITHAVTKGLNPDVTLKDSGVEWLGEVPEHWEIFRLRFLVDQIEQGWSPQCFNYPADDDVWGVLKVGCVNGNQFNEIENKELPNDIEPRIEYEIRAGDILISRANTKELLGSAALVSDSVRSHLLLCDKLYRLISNKTLINEFFILFLRSFATRPHYEKEATGASGSMQNIGQDTVKNLPLTVPPIAEQREIVAYLEEKTGRIDRMVALNQQAIDKLKEYRTALITAAVTGKMDVRHWQQESNHANS